MLQRRLSGLTIILLVVALPLILASVEQSMTVQQKQQCECLNGGTCSSNDKYIACNCPSGFVGTKCQTTATQISQINKEAAINQTYTYFYFQPKQINYYQLSLKICLPQNQNQKFTSLVFLEVERSSGKLKLEPSIYQTSPITFEGTEDRCQIFYTHFIPIRQKINGQFQKVIFGLAIKNNSDTATNRWVNFLQRSTTNPEESLKSNELFDEQPNENDMVNQPQIQSQNIYISCTYELYLTENYWGTFIIILSAITLFLSTAVFLYTMRNKYSYNLSNDDILRLYAVNPEEYLSNQNIKNDLTHFRVTMPIMSYELLVQKQKRAQQKFPRNLLKRKIEVQNGNDKNQSMRLQKTSPSQPDVLQGNEHLVQCEQNELQLQTTCTICLINFQKTEEIRQTPCKHIFHSDCIDSWCETALNCPVCRQSLKTGQIGTKGQSDEFVQN